MTPAISSKHVNYTFLHDAKAFLKNINLEVSPGECILICGRSGSGKTTFSRLLNGISPNYISGDLEGELFTHHLKAGEAAIEDYVPVVGSVFQNPKTQHFSVNTTTELAFPAENMGYDPEVILGRIETITAEFDAQHLLNRDIFKLSGGQKQQIALLSAQMLAPQVLILDEVTSNLDATAIQKTFELIKHCKAKGVTIILTEHRLAWTRGLVDRYLLFEAGQIAKEWSTEAFSQLSNDTLNQLGLRSLDLNAHQETLSKKKQLLNSQEDQIGLTTKDLVTGYKGQPTSETLNVSFRPGEITGLLGPNGVGKSTLANTLTGLLKTVEGQILWNGQVMSSKELTNKSYLVMQDTNYQLFSDSVDDEVLIGAKHTDRKELILELLNLTDLKDRHPMSLSGGQKQRVAIASALLSGKEIIIFDEPTSGLDYDNMTKFGQLLTHIKEKTNTVMIVITHDVELAAQWCDTFIELKTIANDKTS